jgi:hypothetical protein
MKTAPSIPEQIETWNQFISFHIPIGLIGLVSNDAAVLYAYLQAKRGKPKDKYGKARERFCNPSYKTLSEFFGVSLPTITRWVAELTKAGLIRLLQRGSGLSPEFLFLDHPVLRGCLLKKEPSDSADVRHQEATASSNLIRQSDPALETISESFQNQGDCLIKNDELPNHFCRTASSNLIRPLKEEVGSSKLVHGSRLRSDLDHQSQNRQNRDSTTDGGFVAASLLTSNPKTKLCDALWEYRGMEPPVRVVNDVFNAAGEGATEDEIVELLANLKEEGRYARSWKYFVITVEDRFRTKRAQQIADKQQGKLATGKESKGYDPNDPKFAAMTGVLDGEFEMSEKTGAGISGEGGWVPPAKGAVSGATTQLPEVRRTTPESNSVDISGITEKQSEHISYPLPGGGRAIVKQPPASAEQLKVDAVTRQQQKIYAVNTRAISEGLPHLPALSLNYPASTMGDLRDEQTDRWIAITNTQPEYGKTFGVKTVEFMAMTTGQREQILAKLESERQPVRKRKGAA